MNENTLDTVTLLLDNDVTIECTVLTILSVKEQKYIALLAPDEGNEAGMVYLYRYHETEGKEPQIENITDDEEYEWAADAYDEWLDTLEYEELDLDALGLDSLE